MFCLLSLSGLSRAETLARVYWLTSSPSMLLAMKGLLGFPKHVICSTTTRHCSLQAGNCRALGAAAGHDAEGREETQTYSRGWQSNRNLKTCLLLKWENWACFHLIWKLALVSWSVSHPLSASSIGKQAQEKVGEDLTMQHQRNPTLPPLFLHL